MEYRSAITLKAFDTITIPGVGTKIIGAIHQVGHDRYQLRLDEKFVESVTVNVVIPDGEHRTPERHDGPWNHGPWNPRSGNPPILQTAAQLYDATGMTDEQLLADAEGKTIRVLPEEASDLPTNRPAL